ncbi:hypothetical protein SDC9_165238 [bioreactor metagenome]|uniref:Uncharacterized protein n=1 Tax=bioreactor metagenome TaxID=1076179 RepID=A0A645G122_9ZZZZ
MLQTPEWKGRKLVRLSFQYIKYIGEGIAVIVGDKRVGDLLYEVVPVTVHEVVYHPSRGFVQVGPYIHSFINGFDVGYKQYFVAGRGEFEFIYTIAVFSDLDSVVALFIHLPEFSSLQEKDFVAIFCPAGIILTFNRRCNLAFTGAIQVHYK